MRASLVYDGFEKPRIPASMGEPLPDQLQGTHLEQLGELASRICYDSLGVDENGKRRGRSSEALHKHILEVVNTSVYEHCVINLHYTSPTILSTVMCFLNRKGTFLKINGDNTLDITINFRAILDWGRWTSRIHSVFGYGVPEQLHKILQHFGHQVAPQIFPAATIDETHLFNLIDPANLGPEQAHISLYLHGSRGFTHEQVRHRFAMSQRSTRYVDESETPYSIHPLITKYMDEASLEDSLGMRALMNEARDLDRETYKYIVKNLIAFCEKQGLDRTSARKQARGAARGSLGNALESEMIYTASANDWLWMLSQRLAKPADAEIRRVYVSVLHALKASRYAHFFQHLKTIPSPDGIGEILDA
jgi:thymidylate synthase ThyX